MGVTVKLAGVPPSVSVEDLAVNLNKILDNPDIGTFRVRELDPNKCNSTKRWIALDFRSGYDAMYAQDSLHGKEYTLPDRTIVILQAKVTKDPKYMPLDSFEQLKTTLPNKALHHSVEEASNSSSIQPIDNDLPKIKKKPHQKSDKKIKSKLKKIEKKEYELLMEKARLQRELNELSDPEDVPPKKRRSSDVGSKRNSLVDHFSDSSSLRRSSSRDPRASSSRSRRDSSPGDSDSEDVPPKKRCAIRTPDVGTKRISSADHLASKLFRKKYSDVIDSPTLETRRSSSRDLSRSLSRDAKDSLSRNLRRSLSRDARDSLSRNPMRSLSRDVRDSSSREPNESLYQDWRDSPRDARDILNRDPRHSTSRDLRDSLSCDRKRKMAYLDDRRSSYHELGHSSPRDLRDSSNREFRDASYYGSKDTYSCELSVKKEKPTSRELSSSKTPKSLERSSTDRQISKDRYKTIYESEKVPKTRKSPLDAETKVKVEGVKIKSEASESNVCINIRDEAIKDILLETEKLFNELCAKHTVSDADKKRVLKNLFDVINKRMKGLKITSEMGVSCVIMHYRCKYSKVEDNAFLTELFENLVSSRNENEPQPETESPASPAADNIWNIVDAVLQEFELETLEDIKPTIEIEEEPQTVNITVTTDKDNIKTQYTIQDEVNGYYINIIMDKKRIKKFYITIKILLKEMKIHIEKYTNYVYYELLEYVLRGILEKRIVKVLVGKEYMKAKALWSLYRKKYTLEQDGPLVLQTVYAIWEGKYNDEYVAHENNAAVTDSNSNETEKNKEINETPKGTPVVKAEKDNAISMETPEVKTQKDKEVNEISKETPEVITKDKETNETPKEIPAVKTEKDKEVNDISKENSKVIAKNKEVIETFKETPEVKPEKNKVNDIVSKAIPAVKMETDEEVSVLNADKTVTVKTEQTNKENNTVQTRNGSKEVDKMNTTDTLNKDMIKSEKAADTANTATTESGVASNVTAKETEIQKFDNIDEDVIFVENSDVVKVVSDTIKSEPGQHSNDDDVLVVESKIEVIDLSDADDTRNAKEKAVEAVTKSKNLNMEKADQNVLSLPADDILDINVSSESEIDTPGDTHKQNVTAEALATMSTSKTKEAHKATADSLQSAKPMNKPSIVDDVICLSDNENDVIEVVDCETPFDSKIKTYAAHTSQNLEDAEETGTVPAEANGNVDDEVNIIDDNDDNASVDTLILNEEHYLDISEDDHAVELNKSDIIEQNISETANDLKIATVHVEVTKIRPEQKVINNSETDNCNDTVLCNNLGKDTGGVIESCEERNSSLFVEDVEESIQSIQNFLQKTNNDS